MRTHLRNLTALSLITISVPSFAQSEDPLTATPNEVLQFREATPTRGPASQSRGPASENSEPADSVEGDGRSDNPDVNNAHTEGTFCVTCVPKEQLKARPLSEQAREIQALAEAGAQSGNEFADKLQKGAVDAARRCRTTATFRGGGMNSCRIFSDPVEHSRRSKGLSAQGVQEAFKAAGITLGRGHGNEQDANLSRAGLVKTKFEPLKLPGGSVLTCNVATQWGHIEIVTFINGKRNFCSDFCSPTPTCGKASYQGARSYKWPGT